MSFQGLSVFLQAICNTLVDLRSLLLRYLQNPVWSVASLSLRSLILGNHKFLHSIWTNHNVWSKKYICCFLILMDRNTYCIEKKWRYPQSTDYHFQFLEFYLFTTFAVDRAWTKHVHGIMAWKSKTFLDNYFFSKSRQTTNFDWDMYWLYCFRMCETHFK